MAKIKEFANYHNIPISLVKSWIKYNKIKFERTETNRIVIEIEQCLPEVKLAPKLSKPKYKFECETCKTEFFREDWQVRKFGMEKQKFCSLNCRRQDEKGRENISKSLKGRNCWNKGLTKLEDVRLDFYRPTAFKDQGKSTENMLIRKSVQYKLWRKQVFERDNYTCQRCNKKGSQLQADHIKPFCNFKELRFDINNGRTLCKSCHKQTDTYGYKALNFKPE
jgi:hypothetical protein